MKKKILAFILVCLLVLSICPTALAAEKLFEIGNPVTIKETSVNDLSAVFKAIAGTGSPPTLVFGKGTNLDTTCPVVIRLKENSGVTAIDQAITVKNRIYRIELAGTMNLYSFEQRSVISGALTVESGGSLVLTAGTYHSVSGRGTANVIVETPITVKSGGTAYMNRNPVGEEFDKYTAASGTSIVNVEEGGMLHVGAVEFAIPEGSTTSAIRIANGGQVVFHEQAPIGNEPANRTIPDFENPGSPLGPKDASATSDNVAIVEVASGAKLTLKGGKFKTTGDASAITVAAGATVEIPDGSKAVVTSASNDAIDLADGAIIIKGGQVITVGTIDTDDHIADNYVDNKGNIILAQKATVNDGEPMNAAVILPDGTIVEGSPSEAPKVTTKDDGTTTITIPKDGKVTDKDGKVTEMPAGGTVTSTTDENGTTTPIVEKNKIDVVSVNLDQIKLTLTEGENAVLTATVEPADATDKAVKWDSSDTTVATVDENGNVTAVAPGTAIITVGAGDKTASCKVTVEAATVSVTGVTLGETKLTLTEGENAVLTATVAPDNATDKAVTWSSSDESVATVDGNGNVTAVAPGTAIITATAVGGQMATCEVTVLAEDEESPVAIIIKDGVTTNYASLQDAVDEVTDGDTIQILQSDSAIVFRPVTFSVTKAGDVTATITGGSRITVTMSDAGNGTTTYTCTRTPSGGSSSSSGSSSGGGVTVYAITAPSSVNNGSISVSNRSASKGTTVTLMVIPDNGYELSTLRVTDASGNVLSLTDKGNGKYTFTMPASKVTVFATFKAIAHDCPSAKFTDVDTTQWYHEGVDYVIEKSMMNGTGADIFAPDATTTRGMVVTILYRLEKEPTAGTSPFTDVDAGQWYANAVAWAAENGVVSGTSPTTFNPDDPITREQMAAILYRYAAFKGYDVSEKADLTGFADADQISGYAKDAMAWTNQEGLIVGISADTLQPQGSATRAQAATILMRFCQSVAGLD